MPPRFVQVIRVQQESAQVNRERPGWQVGTPQDRVDLAGQVKPVRVQAGLVEIAKARR
jgi:hypothetical protein